MSGVTVVQTVNAIYEESVTKFNIWILTLGIVLIAIGVALIANTKSLSLTAIAVALMIIGGVTAFLSPYKFETIPQTNYIIICDETVTVSELMKEYKIIGQAGNSLIVTERNENND